MLVSDLIKSAYRETNLIALGVAPTTNQAAEALPLFNSIVASTMGFEAGDELVDLSYGGDYDRSTYTSPWVPHNTRLVLNLDSATTLQLDPEPYEGQRLAFVDVGNNLATYPLTLDGNGRSIEGAATLVLNTSGSNRQWIYRADTGSWTKIQPLVAADTVPFPIEFDDYFMTMLAMRLNSRYGQALSAESLNALRRTKTILRARYRRQALDLPTDPGLVKSSGDGSTSNFYDGTV